MQNEHGALTFRWGDPISRALYPVIFSINPSTISEAKIEGWIRDEPESLLRLFAHEIGLELSSPSQSVRQLLECIAEETELRLYLKTFASVAERLWRHGVGSSPPPPEPTKR